MCYFALALPQSINLFLFPRKLFLKLNVEFSFSSSFFFTIPALPSSKLQSLQPGSVILVAKSCKFQQYSLKFCPEYVKLLLSIYRELRIRKSMLGIVLYKEHAG